MKQGGDVMRLVFEKDHKSYSLESGCRQPGLEVAGKPLQSSGEKHTNKRG